MLIVRLAQVVGMVESPDLGAVRKIDPQTAGGTMPTATVTSKGRITIPKDVREDLKLVPGAQVLFVPLPGGRYELVPRTGSIEDLAGILHDPDRPTVAPEAMDDAIAAGATAHATRGLAGR